MPHNVLPKKHIMKKISMVHRRGLLQNWSVNTKWYTGTNMSKYSCGFCNSLFSK